MDVASVYPAIFQRSSAVFCEKSTESIYVSSSLISCKSLLREAGPPMEGHGGQLSPGPLIHGKMDLLENVLEEAKLVLRALGQTTTLKEKRSRKKTRRNPNEADEHVHPTEE